MGCGHPGRVLAPAHAGSSPAPGTMPFGSASARPWYGRAARVGTGGGLHAVVAQQVRARRCQRRGRRFEAGQPLACRTSPIGRGVPFRAGRFAVRVRGSVRKVNRPGRRARPLSEARVTPWRSSRPPSSMEDETAGVRSPSGTRLALRGEFRVLRPPPSPARSHRAGEPNWNENPPGSGHRPESGWPRSGGGRDLLVPQWKARRRRGNGL